MENLTPKWRESKQNNFNKEGKSKVQSKEYSLEEQQGITDMGSKMNL